jgi:hypothetical protein
MKKGLGISKYAYLIERIALEFARFNFVVVGLKASPFEALK